MRFTDVLFKVNYHRHFKRIWKRQAKMEVADLVIPPELKELGVKIRDGKEVLNETKMFKPPVKIEGRPYPLAPSAFTTESPYYKMHNDTKVTEGENQALVLTKTIPYDGLPNEISSLVDVECLPNQDELVKTNILQAVVWDAMQDKLPRPFFPDTPLYKAKRPYGILNEKKALSLLEKLSYLCDAASGKYSESFQRHKIHNAFCETEIKRNGSNILFQMECDIMLKAKNPLVRFASAAEVNDTEKLTVPNIYPLKPTLDLDRCDVNDLQKRKIQYDSSFGRIHTLFMGQKSQVPWLSNEKLAKAISMCFAFSATEAKFIYGEDVGILPEPICIQCMYLDSKSANFLAYQLNTLDLNDNEGIKNQVWIDEDTDLYSNATEADLISDYNPSVFSRMLALYLNGLLPSNKS